MRLTWIGGGHAQGQGFGPTAEGVEVTVVDAGARERRQKRRPLVSATEGKGSERLTRHQHRRNCRANSIQFRSFIINTY